MSGLLPLMTTNALFWLSVAVIAAFIGGLATWLMKPAAPTMPLARGGLDEFLGRAQRASEVGTSTRQPRPLDATLAVSKAGRADGAGRGD